MLHSKYSHVLQKDATPFSSDMRRTKAFQSGKIDLDHVTDLQPDGRYRLRHFFGTPALSLLRPNEAF